MGISLIFSIKSSINSQSTQRLPVHKLTNLFSPQHHDLSISSFQCTGSRHKLNSNPATSSAWHRGRTSELQSCETQFAVIPFFLQLPTDSRRATILQTYYCQLNLEYEFRSDSFVPFNPPTPSLRHASKCAPTPSMF